MAISDLQENDVEIPPIGDLPGWVGVLRIFAATPNASPTMLHENDSMEGRALLRRRRRRCTGCLLPAVVGAVEHVGAAVVSNLCRRSR